MTSKNAHLGPILASKDGCDVIDCEACGFAHIKPLPSEDDLAAFYRDNFYTVEKPDYLAASTADAEWLSVSFGQRYAQFEKLLGRSSGRVLDIGCGPGDFLKEGDERGWTVTGVEPSIHASEFARQRGLDVYTSMFDPDIFKGQAPFDIIHMSEVLEHIVDPAKLIEQASHLLAPGGLVCVSVPNDFNGFQACLTEQKGFEQWWVVPDHHINYFTFDSLEALLQSAGLVPCHRTTNFPMEMFLLMGDNYREDPALGKQLHGKRKAFDIALSRHENGENLRLFYEALGAAGLGRLAIVTARKAP